MRSIVHVSTLYTRGWLSAVSRPRQPSLDASAGSPQPLRVAHMAAAMSSTPARLSSGTDIQNASSVKKPRRPPVRHSGGSVEKTSRLSWSSAAMKASKMRGQRTRGKRCSAPRHCAYEMRTLSTPVVTAACCLVCSLHGWHRCEPSALRARVHARGGRR